MNYIAKTAAFVTLLSLSVNLWAAGQHDGQPTAESATHDSIEGLMRSIGISYITNEIQAASFVVEDLTGAEFDLADFGGQFVFLNFWATWCPPCREEMPSMQVLHDELAADGFTVVALNREETNATVQSFVDEFGYTYPILLDRTGEVATNYAVRGMPTTYFIGPDGRILGRLIGIRHWDDEQTLATMRRIVALAATEANQS